MPTFWIAFSDIGSPYLYTLASKDSNFCSILGAGYPFTTSVVHTTYLSFIKSFYNSG